MKHLRISESGRHFCTADGEPFFWLADTAWELFHRLDRDGVEHYLSDRAAKQFNVIQAVGLAELDGLTDPNAYGERPLIDLDPLKPNERYWNHVDWVIDRAATFGMRVALLPTWGDKWNRARGVGPEVFTPDNAREFAFWLATRFRDRGIIWVLGGDRGIETDAHRRIILNMARAVREADPDALISFHPPGGQGSINVFPQADWLSFHMWQSGHSRNSANHQLIAQTLAAEPKPVIDAEPGYEDHPASFKLENGYLEAYDCRKALYWSVFSGAAGHTYGAHPIWQFWQKGRSPITCVRRSWREALDLPGASQMRHAKELIAATSMHVRIPDASLVRSTHAEPGRQVVACRDPGRRCVLAYLPFYDPLTLDVAALAGERLMAEWFDPRSGIRRKAADVPRTAQPITFQPPAGEGPDWVLVLSDGFERPTGAARDTIAASSEHGEVDGSCRASPVVDPFRKTVGSRRT